MFRIGEFSKLTQVSIRMLRYYDEVGLLTPEVVDQSSGYRGYSANQMETLQRILFLRDSKFTVSEMKEILAKWNDKDWFVAQMEAKERQIKQEMKEQEKRLLVIQQTIALRQEKRGEAITNVGIKSVPEMYILGCKEVLPSYFEEYMLWEKLAAFMKKEKITEKKGYYGNVSLYPDTEYLDKGVTVEVGAVVEKVGAGKDGFYYRKVEGVERMAYAMVFGPYNNLAEAYVRLGQLLEERKEVMAPLPTRQISHIGPCETSDPANYLTEIQIPVEIH